MALNPEEIEAVNAMQEKGLSPRELAIVIGLSRALARPLRAMRADHIRMVGENVCQALDDMVVTNR